MRVNSRTILPTMQKCDCLARRTLDHSCILYLFFLARLLSRPTMIPLSHPSPLTTVSSLLLLLLSPTYPLSTSLLYTFIPSFYFPYSFANQFLNPTCALWDRLFISCSSYYSFALSVLFPYQCSHAEPALPPASLSSIPLSISMYLPHYQDLQFCKLHITTGMMQVTWKRHPVHIENGWH